MPERLPIYDIESDIIARLKSDRRLILSAPTGSGKSTQVPQTLLRHGMLEHGQVVILQPRRPATRLLVGNPTAINSPATKHFSVSTQFPTRTG